MNGVLLPSQLVAEVTSGVRDVYYTRLTSFAVATIVLYDYIICIEREVELIWKKRWSVIKFAFLWHRYFGLGLVIFQLYALNPLEINDKFCTFWFYWETWGYCAVLFTSEAVLLLWIYVVYNKNRYILAIMGACYAAEVAGVLTILALSFKQLHARALQVLDVQYCVMDELPQPFRLLWIPILAYDMLLLLLFLYRGCRSTLRRKLKRASTYGHDNLLDMVYRHSLLNFLAIFGTYLACALIWLLSRPSIYQIPVGFALALSITNCTRLLLNIRRAYYSGAHDALLITIREIPGTGASTPAGARLDRFPSHLLLPAPAPMSPLSATSGLSGSTLREMSVTPVSTLKLGPGVGTGTGLPALGAAMSAASRLSIATTSSEMYRQVAPAHAAGREDPSAVYVTPDLDPEWWQYELREMRADPEISVGEAL